MKPNNLQDAQILLVDDMPANLNVLCELLETEGYQISLAPSGKIALKIATQAEIVPDLILLDVMMPEMNGFETCRRLKQDPRTRDIPVIFITAEDQTESVVAGFAAGGVDYIAKPFQNDEVLVRVRTHLQIDRLTRELAAKNAELSQANAQIREASERKSRFLASIAHELRTPITSIKGYVDNILDGIGGKPNAHHARNLSRVSENSTRLLGLVNDLLDLSKIEAGHMDINPEPFDLNALITSCCAEIGPLVKPGVNLNAEVFEDITELHTDHNRLQQIVINLLSNAAKFTASGDITVRATSNNGTATISVSDTGSGIPSDAHQAIFEEFQQVKGSDPQHQGTGLGLPICKGFVERLGGCITVESQVGKGSTFTVHIPAVYTEQNATNDFRQTVVSPETVHLA